MIITIDTAEKSICVNGITYVLKMVSPAAVSCGCNKCAFDNASRCGLFELLGDGFGAARNGRLCAEIISSRGYFEKVE